MYEEEIFVIANKTFNIPDLAEALYAASEGNKNTLKRVCTDQVWLNAMHFLFPLEENRDAFSLADRRTLRDYWTHRSQHLEVFHVHQSYA